MQRTLTRSKRFLWRATHNWIAATGPGRRFLYPTSRLALAFGPDDAQYGWRVFTRHADQLRELGFDFTARRILEVGPGRNLGGAVLWWAACGGDDVEVTLWDTFENMAPDPEAIRQATRALLEAADPYREAWPELIGRLHAVDAGEAQPKIDYVVASQEAFAAARPAPFDLVLSHSVLEHVWHPEPTLEMLAGLTAKGGWQSMQIDLMDHGHRDTNWLEMLEWSRPAYWLSMAFTPAAVNRWRAQQFVDAYARLDLDLVAAKRRKQDALPTLRKHLAEPFRSMEEAELLTSELFVIARGR